MAEEQDKLAQEWADALGDDEQGDASTETAEPAEVSQKGDAEPAEPAEAAEAAEVSEEATAEPEPAEALQEGDAAPAAEPAESSDEALADEWAAALSETEQDDMTEEKEQAFLDTKIKPTQFVDMSDAAKGPAPEGAKRDLDFILDIPLEVSAELGRTKLLINELLQLGQGSVVELNKLAGEPLEIYVNGKLVARGEAVVINEKFGIRLTDIISPIERVKQLA